MSHAVHLFHVTFLITTITSITSTTMMTIIHIKIPPNQLLPLFLNPPLITKHPFQIVIQNLRTHIRQISPRPEQYRLIIILASETPLEGVRARIDLCSTPM